MVQVNNRMSSPPNHGLAAAVSLAAGVVGVLLSLFGVEFAWMWAVVAFLLNFIPVVGPLGASLLPVILAFLMFDSTAMAAVLTVLLIMVHFTSGSVLEPRLMGKTLNLNTIVVLISLLFWGLIWGIPGMLLALPMTAVLNIIFREIKYFRSVSILLSENDDIPEAASE